MIIDTHCHLDYLIDSGISIAEITSNARNAGVEKMITISTKTSRFEDKILPLIENKEIFCTIGTHPDYSDSDDFDIEFVDEMCLKYSKKIVGIGETGIDLYRDDGVLLKTQIESLEKHIFIAKKYNLPIVFHSRNAENETIEILKKHQNGRLKCVIHCFTGSEDFAKKCLDLGCYISFSGIVTFKNAESIREAMSIVPLDRMVIETDSPFLAPVPHRGKQNSPAFIRNTAEFIAKFLDLDFDFFVKKVRKSSDMLFFDKNS